MRGILTRGMVTVLCALAAGCGQVPESLMEFDGVAIVGAQLIDGTGAQPVSDSVVVVRDGRIAAAGSRADVGIPAGATVVDAAGKTVMPGLVETHAHYHGEIDRVEAQYRKQLYFGVTTARSIGSDPPEKATKALEARAGHLSGPRMYTAGLGFSAPDGFPPGLPVNRPATPEEARRLVNELADQGVHFVKMWVNEMPEPGFKITPQMRTAIVEEAHALGLVPVAHVVEESDLRQLIGLGVTDFLHTVGDTAIGSELIQLCLDRGVTFSPTLTNIEAGWYWAEHPEELEDVELRRAFEPEALERWSDEGYRESVLTNERLVHRKARLERAMAFVKTMIGAGVSVAVGTDSGSSSWNVPMGWGTHRELQMYVAAGLTPMQAIVAATSAGAQLLTQDDADYGTLEPGRAADLLLLNADPLDDIANTLDIDRVMQGGQWLDRGALMPMD
jgi:imidazolonepropionase-like amidohydrolase